MPSHGNHTFADFTSGRGNLSGKILTTAEMYSYGSSPRGWSVLAGNEVNPAEPVYSLYGTTSLPLTNCQPLPTSFQKLKAVELLPIKAPIKEPLPTTPVGKCP